MFIGICGSICAGKSTVAQYLVDHHGFTQLYTSDQINQQQEQQHPAPATKEVNGIATTTTHPNRPPKEEHVFPTAEALLDFVTKRWRSRWVIDHIPNEQVLDMYSRRPFFLLISVDAPLTTRWRRFRSRQQQQQLQQPQPLASDKEDTEIDESTSLATFATTSDHILYGTSSHPTSLSSAQLPIMSAASVRLLNTSSSLAHLYATLGTLDLLNQDRLRPSWDSYFMALASLAAQRSNCMKRRVGCVVVRDKRVVSTGYNGTPRGLQNCGEGGCGRCNEGQGSGHGLATCLCIHAEENALLEAGRERLRDGAAVLYCDTCPCLTCSIKIVQVGISEVVYSQGYSMDGETAAVFREAGVKLRQFVPPAKGLIHLEKMQLS